MTRCWSSFDHVSPKNDFFLLLGCPFHDTPSYNFGFRLSVQKNGLTGDERHEGLVPRNDVLTNGFIPFFLPLTFPRIFFVPQLRPLETRNALQIKKAICSVRSDSRRFDHRSHLIVLYKFCHCSSLSQLMMLALGNSEKCLFCRLDCKLLYWSEQLNCRWMSDKFSVMWRNERPWARFSEGRGNFAMLEDWLFILIFPSI